MITIKDWMEGVKYRVTDSFGWNWDCFGSNAICLESEWGCVDGRTYTVCYDRETMEVYKICSYSNSDCTALRWLNPTFRKAYLAEEKSKGLTDITHFTEVKSPRGWSWLTRLIGF